MQDIEKIDIIIPVYNGLEYLPKLFESLFKNTDDPYRLILVDDRSSDEKVYPFLEKIKLENQDKDILLLRNNTNLGFVKTVNRAVKETKNHFVLVNTDVEVPRGWLERIIYPIINQEKIASATPFTNAGTIFSFPHFVEDNEPFLKLDVSTIDNYFQKVETSNNYVEVPTGVGFCMAFNRKVVQEIGMFDEKSFGRGYGEENDWCQRAIKKGYQNVIVPNLFVYHKHGGSFPSEEKKKLIEENLKKLYKKHPNYLRDVEKFIKNDPLKNIRNFLIMLISSNEENSEKSILFFDHELGGGANAYREKFIQEEMQKNGKVFLFTYDFGKKEFHLRYYFQDFKICYSFDSFEMFFDLLGFIKIEKIIVSQIVSYENPLEIILKIEEIKKITNASLEILIHDFFPICPNYVLLNEVDKFCEIPAFDRCQRCMQKNEGYFRQYTTEKNLPKWRSAWENFLNLSNTIICFSQSSKNIFVKAYPKIENEKIKIIPHQIDDTLFRKIENRKSSKKKLIIGVLGGINKVKGAKIINEMAEIIHRNNLPAEILIIGEFNEKKYPQKIKVHGKYKHRDLPKIISRYAVDIFFIPSIWPETFSYTTQELIAMDFPLAVFDIGAPAERVKNYNKGLVLSEINAKIALDEIFEFCKINEK